MGVPVSASRGFVCLERNEAKWSSESSRIDNASERPFRLQHKNLVSRRCPGQPFPTCLVTPVGTSRCKTCGEMGLNHSEGHQPGTGQSRQKTWALDVCAVAVQVIPHYTYTQSSGNLPESPDPSWLLRNTTAVVTPQWASQGRDTCQVKTARQDHEPRTGLHTGCSGATFPH